MKHVDARGYSCPQPVLMVKKALEDGEDSLRVLVDAEAARENVARFARSRGMDVEVTPAANHWQLDIAVGQYSLEPAGSEACGFLISASVLGNGSDELGQVLMKSFLGTLSQEKDPGKLIFINGGIHLGLEGSAFITILRELDQKGWELLFCGTCLDYFNVKEQLAVGSVTNMFEIVSLLRSGDIVPLG